jgi:hypothetical protein
MSRHKLQAFIRQPSCRLACSFVYGINGTFHGSVQHLEGSRLVYPAATHLCLLDTASQQVGAP